MRLIDALGVGSGGVVVLDGGLSTELERAGVDTGGALWTAAPLLVGDGSVERAHEAFASAGAEVVVTASYQLGVDWLEDRGIDSNAARDLLIESTRAARRGVAGAALVAASVGPFGAGRADGSEYTGDYRDRFDEVRRHHRAKIAVLLESAPDLLAVETIPLADELEIVIEILDEFGSPPAWFSVACRDDATTHGGIHSSESEPCWPDGGVRQPSESIAPPPNTRRPRCAGLPTRSARPGETWSTSSPIPTSDVDGIPRRGSGGRRPGRSTKPCSRISRGSERRSWEVAAAPTPRTWRECEPGVTDE